MVDITALLRDSSSGNFVKERVEGRNGKSSKRLCGDTGERRQGQTREELGS